jgi:hypothetical protein
MFVLLRVSEQCDLSANSPAHNRWSFAKLGVPNASHTAKAHVAKTSQQSSATHVDLSHAMSSEFALRTVPGKQPRPAHLLGKGKK